VNAEPGSAQEAQTFAVSAEPARISEAVDQFAGVV